MGAAGLRTLRDGMTAWNGRLFRKMAEPVFGGSVVPAGVSSNFGALVWVRALGGGEASNRPWACARSTDTALAPTARAAKVAKIQAVRMIRFHQRTVAHGLVGGRGRRVHCRHLVP